jgi:hypothetical protein
MLTLVPPCRCSSGGGFFLRGFYAHDREHVHNVAGADQQPRSTATRHAGSGCGKGVCVCAWGGRGQGHMCVSMRVCLYLHGLSQDVPCGL